MTQTAPLGTNTPTLPAADQPVVLMPAPSTTPIPSDPAILLAQAKPTAPTSRRNKIIAWVAGGTIAAQVVLPPAISPLGIAGGMVAAFQGPILAALASNNLNTAQYQAIAARIADMEARRAEAMGDCMFAGVFGEPGIYLCRRLVAEKFDPALEEARRALARRS